MVCLCAKHIILLKDSHAYNVIFVCFCKNSKVDPFEGDVFSFEQLALDELCYGSGQCAVHVRGTVKRLVAALFEELEGPLASEVPSKYASEIKTIARCDPLKSIACDVVCGELSGGLLNIDAICKDFRAPVIEKIDQWLNTVPWKLLEMIGSKPSKGHNRVLLRLITERRIRDVFEMIENYNSCSASLSDLRKCLVATAMFDVLERQLLNDVETRLLSKVTDTTSLLNTFIKLVKAMKILDPTDIVVRTVANRIRSYLSEREDTVSCIVQSLIASDESDDISKAFNADSKGHERVDPTKWVPPPKTPAPIILRHDEKYGVLGSSKPVDILPMLESLWGSRDKFMEQYASALARVILGKKTWELEQEKQNIQRLKKRFGSSALQSCDVMLLDVMHSSEDAKSIQGPLQTYLPDITVISHHYWPEDLVKQRATGYEGGSEEDVEGDEDLKRAADFLPEEVFKRFREYSERYSELHPHRKLHYLATLGYATIELTIPGTSTTKLFDVDPVQAAVVNKFSSQNTWSVVQLATKLHINEGSVSKALAFWAENGILMALDPKCTQYSVAKPRESSEPRESTASTADESRDGDPSMIVMEDD